MERTKDIDLLEAPVRPAFRRYLMTTFWGACVFCIYTMVDAAMVGQYYGPNGTAAISVITPLFNIFFGFGLMFGIGGSVLYSAAKGRGHGDEQKYFTLALILNALAAAACYTIVLVFQDPLLVFCGAEGELVGLTAQYMTFIRYMIPVYAFTEFLAAFSRNDDDPARATIAVVCGGVFNVVFDYVFIFVLDMGAAGAGLASGLAGVLNLIILLTHLLSKKNSLRLQWSPGIFRAAKKIFTSGFSNFVLELSAGVLTVFFNRQILSYLDVDALSVYGVITNIGMFIMCCGYSVGQAAQPIMSINFGAGKQDRIRKVFRYMVRAALICGVIGMVIVAARPNLFVALFMAPTDAVLTIAPRIIRIYSISFILMPLNVALTYYFQSVLRPGTAFAAAFGRGLVVSGALIMLLPLISPDALWWTMPLTEAIIAVFSICRVRKVRRQGLA